MYMRTHRKALLIRKTGDVRPVVSWLVRRNTSFSIAWPVGCSHKKKKKKETKKTEHCLLASQAGLVVASKEAKR